eukprot:2884082-Rhodomonas_salina.10
MEDLRCLVPTYDSGKRMYAMPGADVGRALLPGEDGKYVKAKYKSSLNNTEVCCRALSIAHVWAEGRGGH